MSQPQEPTEEQLLDALRRVKVDDVVLQTVATLVNLAGQKLSVPEARDPVEAKKAIDAARIMLPLCPPEAEAEIRNALSQVQMLYVREAGAEAGGDEAGAEPAAPSEANAEAAQRARDEEERAKARSKIWTPGSQ